MTKLEETNQPASQKGSGHGLPHMDSAALSTQKLPKTACLNDQRGHRQS